MSGVARRYLLIALAAISVYVFLAYNFQEVQVSRLPETVHDFWSNLGHHQERPPELSPYVRGPPAASFRDNLRNDTKYITSWISAGWTNDVMTYANLFYMGHITDRVSIVPMFLPTHVGEEAGPILFGDVFDVPRFVRDSGIPIVEWADVKAPSSDVLDELGCWNTWQAVHPVDGNYRGSPATWLLNLDISYTLAPDWIKLTPDPNDMYASFWSLARLSFPEMRTEYLAQAPPPDPSPQRQARLPPDDHLLCYDYLFYAGVSLRSPQEFERDYSPVWKLVGQHMRWTPELEALAHDYLRDAFGLPPGAVVPPYISVHIRHGDFRNLCGAAANVDDCFAPLSVIERRVREVQTELLLRKNLTIPTTHVLVASDETDPAWWADVRARGWRTADHAAARTEERFSRWHPVLLDAAMLSGATGFVGTAGSTYSAVSGRRVESWQDGAVRMLRWGYEGADNH